MLVLTGICRGHSSKTKPNNIVEDYILVEHERIGEFGQIEVVTSGVRLSKSAMSSGVVAVYNAMKDKTVCVPVYVSVWKSKAGNVGYDYWLSLNDNQGKPVPLQHKSAAASS